MFLTQTVNGQTFLDAYKKYRIERADTLTNPKTRKKIKSFIKSQIIELDTVFKSYKTKTNFDFNNADTLFLIYDSPAESPFTSDIIIWSGKDTISYGQGFETIKPFKYKRIITYKPFIPQVDRQKGFKVVTERDSLVTLVSKKDFTIINHLGDNQSINDGSFVNIYVAYKVGGQYKFETCFPKQFIILDIYRTE
ncbi:MAG TPA: hypothetical protein PLA68_12240 [Panacibacter sp.]|nr:hypothetical protein [Panacibacter sp.]